MAESVALEKVHEITVAGTRIAGTSRQPEDEWVNLTPDDAIEPPLALDQLARLSQINGTRASIIDAIARNTVGLGYTLEVAEGAEDEVADARDEARTLMKMLEACAARDTRLDSPTLTDLLYAVKTDEEEIGQGYLEVSRSKLTGKIDGLFHAPAKQMRRNKDRDGWQMVQPDGTNPTRFYNFGEKVEYDAVGAPQPRTQAGKSWRTNEIISFRLYSSESRDYGLPRDVALALEYAGDKLASEYNVGFFDAGGTPPTVIFVMSEEPGTDGRVVNFKVGQQTVERVANTIKSDGGHRDRVALVPLPAGSKTEAHTLGTVAERDMGFVNFRSDIVQRTMTAFRIAPIFLAISSTGGGMAGGTYDPEVQRAITLEQVFDPEQDRYEIRLSRTILKDLGYPNMAVRFKRLAVENDAARRQSADSLAEAAAITFRELRDAHGRPPLPEAKEGETPGPGQYPHGINDRLIDKDKPKGAENRVTDRDDQRGQRPGIGTREQQSTDNELELQRERQRGIRPQPSAALPRR